ncbi:hypothetical protein BRADI_1g66035v3, partial [Brachypodium distachyon]
MSYTCPYAQRAWVTRNCKGLQKKIELVPLEMADRPAWYKEIYPKNTDSEKRRFADELLAYSDTFNLAMLSGLTSTSPVTAEAEFSLSKFDDGPFFLGQFSLVDIAYAPFVDGFQIFFADIKNYDTTAERSNTRRFIEEMNDIAAYAHTKYDAQELVALTKKKLG